MVHVGVKYNGVTLLFTFDLGGVTLSLKILSGYIGETIRCRELKLVGYSGWGMCVMSWCDLDLTLV